MFRSAASGLRRDAARTDNHWQTGSLEPIGTHQGTIAGALKYFEDHTDSGTGLSSIHAQTLAILAGFDPQHDAVRLEKVLLPFIRQQNAPEISPSCYWITYVFEVLTARGRSSEVLGFIRDKWTPMADHGTTWEVFNPRVGEESFSHAWSAHPLYHLMQTVGGIRQDSPAWDKILFRPTFEGDRAETIVPTPHGLIRSAWERTDAEIKVRLDLPEGISAKVVLPGTRHQTVKDRSSWRVVLSSDMRGEG